MTKYISILVLFICSFEIIAQEKIAGVLQRTSEAQPGFTLFSTVNSKTTYLMDNCGRVVHTWTSNYNPIHTLYLLPDGKLLRTAKLDNNVITGGGGGGRVELFDWDSNLLWYYEYNTDVVRMHHDVTALPNGNILILAWYLKTQEEALAAGRDPAKLLDGVIWSEQIIEVKPTTPGNGEIVWEWNAWDHLIQDYDNTKPNFGDVSLRPDRINLNYAPDGGQNDWIHANSLSYNPQLDQILISTPFFDELWVIDHSTTTAQAATGQGGLRGKGGDLLYRWGNPAAYNQGTVSDQKLLSQHWVHWIEDGFPSEKKIMYFNNGPDRPDPKYSSVEIITPPVLANGTYQLSGNTYGPINPDRIYTSTPQSSFYSRIMGGGEMMLNGNLLICSSLQGRFFEVNESNEIVWEYKVPITANGIVGRDYFPTSANFASDIIFRVRRYPYNYPAFTGKTLIPGEPIEGQPWTECDLITAVEPTFDDIVQFYPNPANDKIIIESRIKTKLEVSLISSQGQKVKSMTGAGTIVIPVEEVPTGLYLLKINQRTEKIIIQH